MSTTAAMSPTQTEPASEKLGESEFLQQEAEHAKAAIAESLGAIGRSLSSMADPHRLTKDHPWIAMGAAAVAGFTAAATLVPSKEQQTLRALAAIERSLHAAESKESDKKDDKKSGSMPSGLIGVILGEVLKLIRPMLTAILTNAMGGAADSAATTPDANDDPSNPNEAPGISTPS